MPAAKLELGLFVRELAALLVVELGEEVLLAALEVAGDLLLELGDLVVADGLVELLATLVEALLLLGGDALAGLDEALAGSAVRVR